MQRLRLPPHADEEARIRAVLALVAREIRAHLGGRKPEAARHYGAGEMAARLETAGHGCFEPLPQSLSPAARDVLIAAAREAAPPLPGAASTSAKPDFSPDFLTPVKQPHAREFAGRRDLARYLGVSVDWFDRNVERLMREEMFPRQRDLSGQRRWRIETVLSWSQSPYAIKRLARARAAHAKTQAMKDSA